MQNASKKQPVGVWIIDPATSEPRFLARLSVRVSRAREEAKRQFPGTVEGRKPFLARITATGEAGDRISWNDLTGTGRIRLVGHAGGQVVVGTTAAGGTPRWSYATED